MGELIDRCDVDMAINALGVGTPWQALLSGEMYCHSGVARLTQPQRALLAPHLGISDEELTDYGIEDAPAVRANAYRSVLRFLNGRRRNCDARRKVS